jgi:5'-3' exonuclease
MGIPFYFSYLIKNHRALLQKYVRGRMTVDNFFIDANPLIYNSINQHRYNKEDYQPIVENVIQQIRELISTFTPQMTFIAFDGVAPVAKLEQQRGRRYKRRFELPPEPSPTTTSEPFNSIEITPGTAFMKYLNCELKRTFSSSSSSDLPSILYTGPDECGEGEHKIFAYLRSHVAEIGGQTNVIYGLDADLIMLCLNHLHISERLFLFRETPHFIQAIDDSLEPNETYVLDISGLARMIHSTVHLTPTDYIFTCFLLGNDFLPHFPALNIRTGGVTKLLDQAHGLATQRGGSAIQFVSQTEEGVRINWDLLRGYVSELANKEKQYILDELNLRDRKQRNYYPSSTREELQKKINDLPSSERELEKSIQPYRNGWENRYYMSLFGLKNPPTKQFIQQVCNNYLEGLEWTLNYYTGECPNWRWCYRYAYPPLLRDLALAIPTDNSKQFILPSTDPSPIDDLTQLCYVLPTEHLDLVPEPVREAVLQVHPEWYIPEGEDVDFLWAFCKYFFEAHPLLPEIDVDELEQLVKSRLPPVTGTG